MNEVLLKYLKSNKLCIRYFGIKKKYIKCIVDIVESSILKFKVGRKRLLSSEESVLLFLYYLRRYCTLEELSLMFNISVSSAFRYVENMRCMFSRFRFYDNDRINCKCILIDGTETEIERPIENRPLFYSRKKEYSIKSQVTVDKLSRKVVDVCCYEGSVHDFEVFKNRYPNMNVDSETLIVCDAGYQGIKKYHEKSLTIIKRKPDLELSEYQRKCNKLISKFRVTNEHVIGRLKMWKIIGTEFRHCKCVLERFYEYLKIVSELYNLNID